MELLEDINITLVIITTLFVSLTIRTIRKKTFSTLFKISLGFEIVTFVLSIILTILEL